MTKVASVTDIPAGRCKVVQVGEKRVALFNVDGVFYALDNACSHRGGPLGEGRLDGSVVTCPWHGNQFDVTTGRVITGAQDVTAFPVHVQGDDILIDLT